MIGIVPYSERHAEGQRELARRMWPAKRRRRDEGYLRWKFRGPPRGEVPGLLLAVEGSRVVGQLGLLPVRLRVGGRALAAQWACDLMVDDRARRAGVGTLLLRAGMERDGVTLGSEPSPAAGAAMARAGFVPIPGPRKMALPIDPSHVLGWRLRGRAGTLVPVLAAAAGPLARLARRRLTRGGHGAPRAERCGWRDVVPLVVGREATVERPHVVHDEGFLAWRCPGLSGFSPELSAVRTESGGYAIWEATPQSFYVHDWHARASEDAEALFRALLDRAVQAGSRTIRAMAQDPNDLRRLRRFGFLAQRRPVDLIHYPAEPLAGGDRFHYCMYDADGNL